MRQNAAKGFTLIELMIVVVIVAILAAFAISSYIEQVHKSRRADAVRSMGQLQLRLESWRAECPTYANQLSCSDFNGNGAVDGNEPVWPGNAKPVSNYYDIAITAGSATATAYTLTAAPKGAQNGDRCGTYTFSYGTPTAGVLTKSASGGTNASCSLQ